MAVSRLTARECARRRAAIYVGVSEQPPGSNRGPWIDQWNRDANGLVGEPWCMSFQHGMFAACGVTLGGWAGVETFERWASLHGYEIVRPRKGDLVCFDWNADGWSDHVGIVDRVLALRWRAGRFVGWIQTIEGNTGDAVRVRRRWATGSTRFARVPG